MSRKGTRGQQPPAQQQPSITAKPAVYIDVNLGNQVLSLPIAQAQDLRDELNIALESLSGDDGTQSDDSETPLPDETDQPT